MTIPDAPTADWVTIEALVEDPYPVYARLRAETPVAWVPAAGNYFITSYELIRELENNKHAVTATQSAPHNMERSMGPNMLIKDDPQHAVERETLGNTLKPRAVKQIWNGLFERNTDRVLDELATRDVANLVTDFATTLVDENIREVLGFLHAKPGDVERWSQTLLGGIGGFDSDPEIRAAAEQSYREIDEALDVLIPHYLEHPNDSLISGMVNWPTPLPLDQLRGNIKMTIGGAFNEPRDTIAVALFVLLTMPEQRAVLSDLSRVPDFVEETLRWIAPIGNLPRETSADLILGGVRIPAGSKLGVTVASGNRDETVFERADEFDVNRPRIGHLSFGGTGHFCAGSWVGKAQVSIALQKFIERFPESRLTEPVELEGWVLRMPPRLPVSLA